MIITSKKVTIIKATETNKFQLDFITDNPKDKIIMAQVYPLYEVSEEVIQGEVKFLTLWEGTEYDNIGDWTQLQAINRINHILINL